MLRQWFFV
ncbi:hypothetical protein LEMLEM_LOCUS22684 [Lemmus lemmus]